MFAQTIRITTAHHVAVDIAAPPDIVWQVILDEYVEALKFRAMGYSVDTLDDPAAVLGGYRMRLEQKGVVVDERSIFITERDETARRLSLFADYLSAPAGMQVYATYHAQKAAGGTRYALDCHANPTIEVPSSGAKDDVATAVAAMRLQSDRDLLDYLESIKSRIEAASC